MNIIVIGLESMGKRRIRLLKKYIYNECLDENMWKVVGIDSNIQRCEEVKKNMKIDTYSTIDEALENNEVECAVISTSPLTHASIIKRCLDNDLHVFSELNLVSNGYEDNVTLAKKRDRVLFLSSTFLYRKEIAYIKDKIQGREFKGSYRYRFGQYLPEWHPWESYKDFFVADKRTNACREIMAIELPWLIDIFGEVKSFQVLHKKISNMEINYDDSYQIIIEHETGVTGNFMVDIVIPKAGRELEVWEENFYLLWNGTPDSMYEYNEQNHKVEKVQIYDSVEHVDGYNQFIVENAYYDEIVNFIETIQGKKEPRYSFEKDMEILRLIDNIEK